MMDVNFANYWRLRADFPAFSSASSSLVIYFDSAASTFKPKQVIDELNNYYVNYSVNLHRGLYNLAEDATAKYEEARAKIAEFIGANTNEIVFNSGATEGINFVASTWAESNLYQDDEIIISELEHHSNLLPWQVLAKKKNLKLKYLKLDKFGNYDLKDLKNILSEKTKLIALSLCSNVLGVKTSVPEITKIAKKYNKNIKVLIDAAQAVPYMEINTKELNCDFLVFSGHKMFGPTGIGVLYISEKLHKKLEPYKYGGGMVFDVSINSEDSSSKTSWIEAPNKYEAGTPPIAQALGLASAVDYYKKNIDFVELEKYLASLCELVINKLKNIPGLKILGDLDKVSKEGHIITFTWDKHHSHDLAEYLNKYNICVRAGHHCAKLLHDKFGLKSSVRVSFHVYNTLADVNTFIESIERLA